MKTRLSDLRFGTYILSKSATSTKTNTQDDDFDEIEDEAPWICCKCGSGNDAEAILCYDCGHDRCAKCSEIQS